TWIEAGGRWHELGPDQGMPANSPFFFAEHGGYLYAAGIRGVSRVPLEDLPRGRDTPTVHGEMLLNERGDPNAGQRGYCCNGAGLSRASCATACCGCRRATASSPSTPPRCARTRCRRR